MCEEFAPNFGDKKIAVASRHFLSHQRILTKNNMSEASHSLYFSLFPRLTIKLKGSHFDTIEVIKEESQMVLNTLSVA
jgi:hypothetical protein